jgi:hypothetical protein
MPIFENIPVLPADVFFANITISQLLSIHSSTLSLRAPGSPDPNLERSVKVLLQILTALPMNPRESLELVVLCVMPNTASSIDGTKYKLTPEFEEIMRGTFQNGNANTENFSPEILALHLYTQCQREGAGPASPNKE